MAQIQIYLKIKLKQNGVVTGSATADGHAGDLLIDTFRWSESLEAGTSGGRTANGSSQSVKDFEFTMAMNRASPIVMLASLMMDPVLEATLCCRHQSTNTSATTDDFVKWTLQNGVISSYETLGSVESVIPRDRFTIRFRSIGVNFRPIATDGSLGTTISAQFDLGTMSSGGSSSGSSAGGGGGSAGGGGGGGAGGSS